MQFVNLFNIFCNEIVCRILKYENYERVELTNCSCCKCLTVELQLNLGKQHLPMSSLGELLPSPSSFLRQLIQGRDLAVVFSVLCFLWERGWEVGWGGGGWLSQVPTGPDNKLPSSYRQRFSGCLLCAMFSLERGMRGGERDDSARCLLGLKTSSPAHTGSRDLAVVFSALCFL